MTSNIFNSMGLGQIDPAIIFISISVVLIALIVSTIVLLVKYNKLNKKYNKFMEGKNGRSLENEVMSVFDDIRYLKSAADKADDEIVSIKNNLTFAYQKMGIVRYDAFREMGGKLSFSIALLNDRNDGYVLNSVHSSEGCYTYIKEIVNGESYIDLGDEEREALDKALSSQTSVDKNIKKSDFESKKVQEKNPLKNPDIEVDLEPIDMDELGLEEM